MTPEERARLAFTQDMTKLQDANAAQAFQDDLVRLGLAPATKPATDEGWLSRTAGRAGAAAADATVNLLDAVTFDQFDMLDSASDYWKQKQLENPHDTGNIRESFAAGPSEFGKFLVENLGDSIGTMFPSLVLGVLSGGAGSALMATRGAAAVGGTGITAAQGAQWGAQAGMRAGMMGGVLAGGAVQHGNETVDTLRAEGLEPTALNVAPTALAKSALDAFGLGKMASGLGLGRFFGAHVVEEVGKRGLTGLAKNIGVAMAAEGVTEALQEAIDVGVVAALKDESLWKAYPREMQRIVDAGLTGAALGGTVAGIGQAMPQADIPGAKARAKLVEVELAKKRAEYAKAREAEQNAPIAGGYTFLPVDTELAGTEGVVAPYGMAGIPIPFADPETMMVAPSSPFEQPAPVVGTAEAPIAVTPTPLAPMVGMEEDGFAVYAPYDGGVTQERMTAEALTAGLHGKSTTTLTNTFTTNANPAGGIDVTVTNANGKTRRLFTAQISVNGDQVSLTVPKMVGVQSNAIQHFLDSVVTGVRAHTLGAVRVNMPYGTGRLWGKIAQAYGASVDINGFTFRPKTGAVHYGVPVTAEGLELRPQVVVTAGSPKILSITALGVGKFEEDMKRLTNTYAYDSDVLHEIRTVGGVKAAQLSLPPMPGAPVNNGRLATTYSVGSHINSRRHSKFATENARIAKEAISTPGVYFTDYDNRHRRAKYRGTIHDFGPFLADMQAQVKAWHAKFTPTHSVIVVPYYAASSTEGGSEVSYTTKDGRTVAVLSINLASRLPEPVQTAASTQLSIMNTMAHEFGHFLHDVFWHKAPQELITAVKTEMMALKSLSVKYTQKGLTAAKFPTNLANHEKLSPTPIHGQAGYDKWFADYYLTDVEIFAKNMAEILLEVESKNPGSPIAAYIRSWIAVIEEFLASVGWPTVTGNKAMKSFYKWMENPDLVKSRARPSLAPPVKPVLTDLEGYPVLYEHNDSIAEMGDVREDSMQGAYVARDLDIKGFWWMKKALNMPQLVDRFKVPALEVYWGLIKKIKVLKSEVIGEADLLARRYGAFKADRRKQIASALYQLNDWSEQAERRFEDVEMVQILAGTHPTYSLANPLGEAEIKYVLDVQANFLSYVRRMEYANKVRAAFGVLPDINVDKFVHEWDAALTVDEQDAVMQKYTGQPVVSMSPEGEIIVHPLPKEMRDISAKYAGLKNSNYVPKMRHGQNVMRITAVEDCVVDGKPFAAGETILFQGFDRKLEMESASKEAMASANGMGIKVKIDMDILKDSEFSAIGLPRAFIDALKDNEALEFTNEQKKKLERMAMELSPSRSFLKQFIKRQNIDGYSMDWERTYSGYAFRAAGHIAKTQYERQVNYAIREFDKQKDKNLDHGIANNSAWTELQNFVKEHFRYVMSSDTDFSRVRSLVSAWYLGFMPRSAIANLYQVPMATYPYLAGKFGDIAAVKAIAGAYKVTENSLKKGKIPLHIEVALKRAMAEQHIDSSAIVELGAMGDSNFIDRVLNLERAGTSTQKLYTKWVIDRGFYLFRNAEKINRRTSFLATFQLEYDLHKDAELAYQEAVKSLELTQFDMSKEARAEMFRGGKGILFMFNQHLMGMTYLAFGGFSASKRQWATGVRVLAMSAVLAGTEGLPWAGLGMDLFDLIAKLYKQISGEEYTYSDVRADIRELYQSLGADPEMWMHGMSRKFGLGPLSVATLFGGPEIDLSGSIGLGYPGSWAQMIKSTEGTAEERWAKMMESLGGPAYSVLNGMWRAVASNDPNEWKANESAMPAFMRAISQGARWVEQGGEHTKNGALIYPVGDDNLVDAGYRAMGLTPTKLSELYAANGMVAEAAAYWGNRKNTLLQEYAYAKDSGDSDMLRTAQENIRRYNDVVRDKEVGKSFMISPKSLATSYKRRRAAVERVEQGMSGNKAHQQLLQSYQQLQQPASELPEQLTTAQWGG